MTNDFIGFNFLSPSLHPVADIRRGYAMGPAGLPEQVKAGVAGAAITADTTVSHGVVVDQHMLRLDF